LYIGLSEASPETIRRAHAVHALAAVQTEYSIWTRDLEDEVLPASATWRSRARLRSSPPEKGVTPAQLALAWLLAQGDDVVPIPGTKRRAYLEQNVGALDVELSDEDLARIDAEVPEAAGARDDEAGMQSVNV
jgi:aryl-alcohol dehydrogenase-like predicted oxidoreductase